MTNLYIASLTETADGVRAARLGEEAGSENVRLLMISEMTAPNISIYPDTDQVGVFDAAQRAKRRFGALFDVGDAVADTAAKRGSFRPHLGHARRSDRARFRRVAPESAPRKRTRRIHGGFVAWLS